MGDRPPRELSRQALAEVVEPRYDELFTLVQAELRRSGYEDLIPAGIVLTGGTAKMEGATRAISSLVNGTLLRTMQGLRKLLDRRIFESPSRFARSGCRRWFRAGQHHC